MTNAEVLHQVEHGYRMPSPPNCPPALYEIMLETWHKDPMKRPTFETLQWKLEDFFTIEGSEYKEAAVAYWLIIPRKWETKTTSFFSILLEYF